MTVFIVACLTACVTHGPSLDWTAAHQLAVTLTNDEAFKRYDVRPFVPDASKIRTVGRRWVWEGTAGYGRSDLVAKVSFALDGKDPRVDVHLLVNGF